MTVDLMRCPQLRHRCNFRENATFGMLFFGYISQNICQKKLKLLWYFVVIWKHSYRLLFHENGSPKEVCKASNHVLETVYLVIGNKSCLFQHLYTISVYYFHGKKD